MALQVVEARDQLPGTGGKRLVHQIEGPCCKPQALRTGALASELQPQRRDVDGADAQTVAGERAGDAPRPGHHVECRAGAGQVTGDLFEPGRRSLCSVGALGVGGTSRHYVAPRGTGKTTRYSGVGTPPQGGQRAWPRSSKASMSSPRLSRGRSAAVSAASRAPHGPRAERRGRMPRCGGPGLETLRRRVRRHTPYA